MDIIRMVCATRHTEEQFHTVSALGRTFAAYSDLPKLELRVFPENRAGLGEVYNIAINETRRDPAILVFIHDDVHLIDLFWSIKVYEAMERFEIIGIAGNARRVAGQVSWMHIDEAMTPDKKENLAGVVAHGPSFPSPISWFGGTPRDCKTLDGVFLAAHSEMLWDHGLKFDELFKFHFYDMDFCRQAEVRGIKMSTYPIGLLHESIGNAYSPEWREALALYRQKWGS